MSNRWAVGLLSVFCTAVVVGLLVLIGFVPVVLWLGVVIGHVGGYVVGSWER